MNAGDETRIRRYALIDLARARTLRPLITKLKPPMAVTLLHRSFRPDLLAHGSWIVDLDHLPGIERVWRETGWDDNWGVLVFSRRPLLRLRSHWRQFNKVRLERTEQEVFFRYYDPRVLREFLPIATPHQYDQIMHGIDMIICPARNEEKQTRFTPSQSTVCS